LSTTEILVLTEVFPAGEKMISGADGHALSRAIRARGKVDPILLNDVESLGETLVNVIKEGDVVLTLGAGNIGAVVANLPAWFEQANKRQ